MIDKAPFRYSRMPIVDAQNRRRVVLDAFIERISTHFLPVLREVFPICTSSIDAFHFAITTIAQQSLEDLLREHQLHYDNPDDCEIIHLAFLVLISEFNGVLPLDYPFLIVGAQKTNRPGVALKAMYRSDIPALREATVANMITIISVDRLLPGPLRHVRTSDFRHIDPRP